MSWMKRRGQPTIPNPSSAPPPPPPVQMYNPNQQIQTQWSETQAQANNWLIPNKQGQHQTSYVQSNFPQSSQQTNYWQQSHNQQTASYNQNTNQYNQQFPQYNQLSTGFYENNTCQHPTYPTRQSNNPTYNYGNTVSNHIDKQSQPDTWSWGWGDEDNSNVQNFSSDGSNINSQSNTITDSFVSDEAWNWSVEDTSNTNLAASISNENNTETHATTSNINLEANIETNQDSLFPKMGKLAEKHNIPDMKNGSGQTTNSKTFRNSENPSPNHTSSMTNLKHNKSENLISQWSTESQISSQDSSDLLHTSESDKSHVLSRSSTISESPISGHDLNSGIFMTNRHEAVQSQPFHTQTESENTSRNVPSSSSNFYLHDNYNLQLENKEVLPYDSRSDMHPTPPPPIINQKPPLSSGGEDLKNSYKRTTGLSHKATNKYLSEGTTGTQTISGNIYNQSVNLETLPDNSEQPDSFPQQNSSRKLSSNKPLLQQWSENSEIAPINDRNQYLETGQLSNTDFVSINQSNQTENFDAFPPPGFTRMVLGQMEHSANNSRGYEEPPPGLSRMVLGQTETTPLRNDVNELPVGLHRMIPGEASSPEAVRQGRGYQKPTYPDSVASESEPNQLVTSQVRSATIGADTPPVTGTTNTAGNRSETIGADISESYNSTANLDNKKMNSQTISISSRYNNNVRDTNADGANNLDESIVNPIVSNRRAFIEGQPPDIDNKMNNLVNAVRDLTVGENPTDIQTSTLPLLERSTKRSSRQESTDSEQEHENRSKISKEKKDKRYNDKLEHYGKEKHRYTYSPFLEHSKDKRHDRRRYKNASRYDDDTDGYSDREKDKRRDDRDRREDFERKYSSLKKDKEKERKRREQKSHHEYSRDSRRPEHYNRYDDDYDDHNRSRPSSRSDSMHESYRLERDRHRDRDRDRRRRHRDPFNPYLQGYTYDPYNPYYQQYQYQYYENFRRTNPQAYAEWYKYYQQSGIHQGYGNEDRASVHSGRSSANDELAKDRYTHQSFYSQASLNYYRDAYTRSISGHYGLDESRPFEQSSLSLYQDGTTVASQRLTPAKFATAHIKASIASGVLVKIFPHYPLDGQAAMVEVSNLHEMLSNNKEYKDLVEFPGPLVKGITHKKTIIEFCENKICNANDNRNIPDVDSYILMWELLILLLRQNGMVVGTDIAELLMKHRKQLSSRTSVVSNSSSAVAETTEANNIVSENNSTSSILKEEIVTNKFRDYLIYGSEKEALEWAMKHGLWGHALFLASKLDKRTYANVMTRFANGLPINDPLQTLYQLLSGKVPSAVTSVADEKWGDWRPHLAMILSNTTQRPELDRKSITTLADTLLNRGSLYAAQFCYLMAQVGFSRYGSDGAKLVLLGSNHNKPFLEFAANEAIHMTEIYEYACSLNDAGFIIPEFQPYKYLIATRLADHGLLEKALTYLEKITLPILQNPSLAQSSLLTQVCQLADRLKFCDSVEADFEGDGELEISRPDNSWLQNLKQLEKDYSMGLLRTDDVDNYASQTPEIEPSQIGNSLYEEAPQEIWQHQYTDQQQWQSAQYADQQPLQTDYQTKQQDAYASDQHQDQQKYWLNQQQQWNENQSSTNLDANNQLQDNILQHNQTDYWNSVHSQQEEVVKQPVEDVLQPQISMPNQLKGLSTLNEEQDSSHSTQAKKELAVAPKIKQQNKPATTGWFGGIWNKLSLRPKNQMKLPDDKNPTIVWDENKKRWINLEAEADGTATELKPPPKMSEMLSNKQQPNNSLNQQFNFQNQSFNTQPQTLDFQQNVNNIPLANDPNTASQVKTNYTQQAVSNNNNNEETISQLKPTQPNMFKLQRNRNIKKAYVDVFNPGAKSSNMGTVPVPDTYGTISNNNPQMNFFIPAPVTDPNVPTDFLTPAPVYHSEDNTQKHPHQQ